MKKNYHHFAKIIRDGYILIDHNNKNHAKNLILQTNNLANYFLKKNYYKSKSRSKLINKLICSNSLSQKSLYEKFYFLKNKYPSDSSKIYKILGNDLCLHEHYNDLNIINSLKNLCGKKNIFKIAQQVRIDISPYYHHSLAWHQDHFDFNSNRSGASLNINYIDSYTVWSPFTKANINIGTMEILVGSHKYGRLKHNYQKSTDKKKSAYLELTVPKNILEKCKSKVIDINGHQSVIFSMNTIHRTVIGKSKGVRLTGWARFTSTSSNSFNKMIENI